MMMAAGPEQPLQNTCLLVAEDSPDAQRLLATILTKAGAEVVLECNGAAAVEQVVRSAAAGRVFDAVLMDLQMPQMDGFEAVRQLRSRGFEMPIIAVTIDKSPGVMQRCRHVGIDDFVAKPVDRAFLLETLTALIPAVDRTQERRPARQLT